MKRKFRFSYTLVALFLMFMIHSVQAQGYNEKQLERTKKMYDIALNSDVEGLVESAIYNVLVMKNYYPEQDYSKVIRTLDRLASAGSTVKIQYKAQLAGLYLKNTALFSDIQLKSAEDPAPYFQILSDRMEQLLFSTASL